MFLYHKNWLSHHENGYLRDMDGIDGIDRPRVGRPSLGDQARKQISVRLAPDVYEALKTHADGGFGQELDRILREHYGIADPDGPQKA